MEERQFRQASQRNIPVRGKDKPHRTLQYIESLPSLPAVAVTVLSMSLDDDVDLDYLAKLIESDPSISMKILKFANSVAMGSGGTAANIKQAAVVLGLNRVRCILLSICVQKWFLQGKRDRIPTFEVLWSHSITAAVSGELLAEISCPKLKDDAFLAGLLHDIGKLVMCVYLPEEYKKLRVLENGNKYIDIAAEQNVLNMDHTLIGRFLATKWGLPSSLVDSIWLHHQPAEVLTNLNGTREIIGITMMANQIAHEFSHDSRYSFGQQRAFIRLRELFQIQQRDIDRLKREIGKRYAERAQIFDLETNEIDFYYKALQNANQKLGSLTSIFESKQYSLNLTQRTLQTVSELGFLLNSEKRAHQICLHTADTMREKLDSEEGLVYWLNYDNKCLQGLMWNGKENCRRIHCPLSLNYLPPADGIRADLPEFAKEILSTYPQRATVIFDETNLVDHLGRKDSFIIIPLVAEKKFLGEIWFKRGDRNGVKLTPQESLGFTQIGSLVSNALRRLTIIDSLEIRNEDLADAILKNEQTKNQLIQVERMAAVGQLAAGAAHEINNPLAIISARTQLLQNRESDQAKCKDFQQIIDQIDRISSLLLNLMGFARPMPPTVESVALNGLLDRVITLVKNSFEKKRIRIERKFDMNLPPVHADKKQLEQVFLNVLINAYHAMEKSGGVMTIATRIEEDKKHIQVEFRDTGIGISPENLKRIFEPFFTTKEDGKGTGLGLSTSLGLIKSHRGDIRIESVEGEGTSVVVILPHHVASIPLGGMEREAFNQAPLKKVDPPRILIVDDEDHIRQIMKEALEEEGFITDSAVNGEDGMEKLKTGNYSLLILDIKMPVRNGFYMLSGIKAMGLEIPVIVITGFATNEQIEAALKMGARKCFRKPFQIKPLVRIIEEILVQEEEQ